MSRALSTNIPLPTEERNESVRRQLRAFLQNIIRMDGSVSAESAPPPYTMPEPIAEDQLAGMDHAEVHYFNR